MLFFYLFFKFFPYFVIEICCLNFYFLFFFPIFFLFIIFFCPTRHTEHCTLLVAFGNSSRRQFVKLKSDSVCLYNIYGSDRYG